MRQGSPSKIQGSSGIDASSLTNQLTLYQQWQLQQAVAAAVSAPAQATNSASIIAAMIASQVTDATSTFSHFAHDEVILLYSPLIQKQAHHQGAGVGPGSSGSLVSDQMHVNPAKAPTPEATPSAAAAAVRLPDGLSFPLSGRKRPSDSNAGSNPNDANTAAADATDVVRQPPAKRATMHTLVAASLLKGGSMSLSGMTEIMKVLADEEETAGTPGSKETETTEQA